MRVDWDTYRGADVVRDPRIPRRSTLVMFTGGEEIGRLVAETAQSAIEALFQSAL